MSNELGGQSEISPGADGTPTTTEAKTNTDQAAAQKARAEQLATDPNKASSTEIAAATAKNQADIKAAIQGTARSSMQGETPAPAPKQ